MDQIEIYVHKVINKPVNTKQLTVFFKGIALDEYKEPGEYILFSNVNIKRIMVFHFPTEIDIQETQKQIILDKKSCANITEKCRYEEWLENKIMPKILDQYKKHYS